MGRLASFAELADHRVGSFSLSWLGCVNNSAARKQILGRQRKRRSFIDSASLDDVRKAPIEFLSDHLDEFAADFGVYDGELLSAVMLAN
jgi:hypothetical protein